MPRLDVKCTVKDVFAFCIVLTAFAQEAHAQPAPSFSATCDNVRRLADRLNPAGEEVVVIEVTGELLLAQSDGILAYMGMCGKPAPRVLCATYRLDDYKVGDRVTIAGSYHRNSPDFITLDPCLHYPPESGPR